MDFMHAIGLFVVLMALFVNSQRFQVPCTDIFNYHWETEGWVGRFDIEADPEEVWLNVRLHISVKAITKGGIYGDVLRLEDDLNESARRIANNQTLRYIVRFLSEYPVPKIIRIEAKCKTICTGQGDDGVNNTFTWFGYDFFPRGSNRAKSLVNRPNCSAYDKFNDPDEEDELPPGESSRPGPSGRVRARPIRIYP